MIFKNKIHAWKQKILMKKFFRQKKGGFIKDIITVVLLVVFVVVPIRVFIAQPFIVFGESMSPTFEKWGLFNC